MGSIAGHRVSTAEMSLSGLRVFSVDYRMAPEAPFPAGVVDAVCTYKYLLGKGEKASNIVVSGDSAGGGLVYSLVQYLRDHQTELPKPAGIAALTPWIDSGYWIGRVLPISWDERI
jgi:monoterpene epsilon-lactone hydrolase